jgi:prophage regulatory protein
MQTSNQQILFINDLEQIIGRNRLTLRRWWLAGKFPKPVRLNGSDLAWHLSAITEWIEQSFLHASESIN